jgi:adenylosuccinate lyase
MTTQEFLSKLTPDIFSEPTRMEVQNILGTATEITPELADQVAECLEREIDAALQDVEVDSARVQAIEAKAAADLAAVEETVNKNFAVIQQNVSQLVDMSKKVDVLERLHS